MVDKIPIGAAMNKGLTRGPDPHAGLHDHEKIEAGSDERLDHDHSVAGAR